MVESEKTRIVIDTGPDFRQQMLREDVKRLDAVLFTHAHKDHIAGLDDVRAFNYFLQRPMDVYATPEVKEAIRIEYYYAFDTTIEYPGIPKIELHTIGLERFDIGDIHFIPIQVMHYRLPVKGFRFGDFVYITDANNIPDEEKSKIKGAKVLVLNALRVSKHISHFSLEEALEVAAEFNIERTFFTHISHQLGLHEDVSRNLPEGIFLSYDGLKLEL